MKYRDIRFLLQALLMVVSHSLLHAQVPANVPVNGLIAWYPFSGNADDQSGNHHDGKMYFTQFTQDRNGVADRAVVFNGVNAWIDSNIDSLQARALTISCWFTTGNFNQEYQGLVVARNLNNGGTGLYLFNGQDYIQQITNCVFDERLAFRDSLPYTGKWHHFAATFDGVFLRNYVDGNLVAEDSLAMDLCIQQSFHIGRDACCQKSYFQGSMDDVGIWNRALSADEIRNLWLPAPPPATCLPEYLPRKGLVAFWPFCGNAQDESGNGQNGITGNNQFVEDRNGVSNAALGFDGIDDYVEVPHHPDLNAFPMTVSFWMKGKPGVKPGKILDKYCCSDWNGWNIEIVSNMGSSGELHFEYLRGTCLGIFQTYCNSVPYPKFNAFDNQWHLFTFTLDSLQAIVYFDSKPVFTQQWIGGPSAITNTLPLNIGRYGTGNFAYLQGELDDIGIWNRVLTAQEVADLYYGENSAYCSGTNILNAQNTYNTVEDIDGNVYPSIKIGSQEWMAQNLRVSRFNDGTLIKSYPDAAEWSVANYPFWTTYEQDTTLLCPFGALYNGYVATDAKNVCPAGWHVPTDQDWSLLVNTLGGPVNALGKLKVPGTDYWVSPNSGASNSSGFSALPGGIVLTDGNFGNFGWDAVFWTSTSTSPQQAYYRGLRQSVSNQVVRIADDKMYGFSIRCVKDQCIPVTINLTASVCANDYPYLLGGSSYTGPGTYTDTIYGPFCDTIRVLTITSLPLQTTTVLRDVCANEFPYTFDGQVYLVPGTYIDTLGNTLGCDIVRILNIVSIPLDTIGLTLEICSNQFPYTFAGQVLTGPGTYYDALSGPGCDTIRVISVLALPSDNASAIQVTTLPVTGITFTSALGGGVVAGNGCASVTLKGIVWSTMPNPTIVLMSKTVNGPGFGAFGAQISPLQPNTLYYVRAYATNSTGVVYGNTITFTTPATPGPELTLFMDTLTAFSGSQIVVPVKVKNFQQLISAQFSIKFNPAVLTFAGIEQFGLDSLGLGSFGLNQSSNGILGFAWSQPNLQPASRPDGHVIFALRFTVSGAGGSFSAVRFDDDPVVIEFVNGAFTVVNPYHLYPGRVEVLQDLTLSGSLKTEIGAGVRSALVTVGNFNLTTGQQTPLNGQFSFLLPPTQTYTLTPVKNNDTVVTNGVTTFDGLLIQRHVVGIQNLSSPYKIIAGDVNRSGFLSVTDILLINNLVLGNITSYPNGPLWTFVPSDYIFTNPLQPFPYPSTRTYSNFAGAANQDFVGMKLGDVNNSYNPAIARQMTSGKVAFTISSTEGEEGSRIRVPVKVSQFEEIAAFQFSVQWDANVLRYAGIEDMGGLLALNIGETLSSKGQLNVNWIHPESLGATLADGEVLFYLVFDVVGDAGISSAVSLFSSLTTPIEVVTEQLTLLDVEVEKGTITVSSSSGTEDLSQRGFTVDVIPNPFSGQARIRINSLEPRQLRLEVLDLSGRRLAMDELVIESGTQVKTLQHQFGQGVTILQVTDKDDVRVQVRVKLVSID